MIANPILEYIHKRDDLKLIGKNKIAQRIEPQQYLLYQRKKVQSI